MGKHRREVELRKRVEKTIDDLDMLYQRAVVLLDNAGVNVETRSIGGVSRILKRLGLGLACITCLHEYSLQELRVHLLDDHEEHIYSKTLLKEEKHRVFKLLEESSEQYLKAKIVFAVKKALL